MNKEITWDDVENLLKSLKIGQRIIYQGKECILTKKGTVKHDFYKMPDCYLPVIELRPVCKEDKIFNIPIFPTQNYDELVKNINTEL